MRFLQDGTAKDDCAIRLEVLCRNGRDFNSDFLPIAHEKRVKDLLVVHDIQLRHAGDQPAIQCEDDIAFLEGFDTWAGVERRRGTVDLADHEELMA